jgi:hypothetical protein
MNHRYLPADKPADQDLPGVGDGIQDGEYAVTLRMCPPATLDHFADDRFGQAGGVCLGRDKDNAMPLNERECILSADKGGVHDA